MAPTMRCILVVYRKFCGVPFVGFVPVDLNDPGYRERLRRWPDLTPRTTQKKQQALADLRAIRQENLRPHAPAVLASNDALPVRTSGAMRGPATAERGGLV